MSVDDMSLTIVITFVTSLENLRLVEENWSLETTNWTAKIAISWDVMIKRIIDSSLIVDLKSEFIPVSEIKLCVSNSDQKTSVAFNMKLLRYFEDMLMLLIDIYWISEAILAKLESAKCQLIVVIEAKYAKESILSLSSIIARIELCALSSIVMIVVLAVIIAVLVTVTEIDLAVSEMCVDSQLKSILNDAELACKMLSCETWLLFMSLYKKMTQKQKSWISSLQWLKRLRSTKRELSADSYFLIFV